MYTYRFRVALVQIQAKDLASYLDERHSLYVFLPEQEISKSYIRNIIPLALKKKVPHAKLMGRDAKYTFGSRDSTAVTVTKLRAALMRDRGSNPGRNKKHFFSEAPRTVLRPP